MTPVSRFLEWWLGPPRDPRVWLFLLGMVVGLVLEGTGHKPASYVVAAVQLSMLAWLRTKPLAAKEEQR